MNLTSETLTNNPIKIHEDAQVSPIKVDLTKDPYFEESTVSDDWTVVDYEQIENSLPDQVPIENPYEKPKEPEINIPDPVINTQPEQSTESAPEPDPVRSSDNTPI